MEQAKFCYKCEKELFYPEKQANVEDLVKNKDSVESTEPQSSTDRAPIGDIEDVDKIKFCPSCGTPMFEFNKNIKCDECGAFFCVLCEMAFRGEKRSGNDKPLCVDCFYTPLETGTGIPMNEVENKPDVEEKHKEAVTAKPDVVEAKVEEGKINRYRCTLCKEMFSAKSKGKKYDVFCPHCKGRITIN
jgi:DNA-directed RNA polymerase subunit RPC12/RpoP